MVTTLGPAAAYMLFFLGAAGIAGVTFKVAQAVNKNMSKTESKAARNKRLEYLKGVKEYEKSLGRENTEISRIEFKNGHGDVSKYNFEEVITFDEEKDKMYRGVLYYYQGNNWTQGEDIYLFQPRLLFKNGTSVVTIRPNDIKGYLERGQEYKYRNRGTQDPKDVYVGYTPKREVLTGNRFDFIKGEYRHCIDAQTDSRQAEVNAEDQELRQHIVIMVPKLPNGNLVPVNLQDPKEKEAFEAYKAKHLNLKDDPKMLRFSSRLTGIIQDAKKDIADGFRILRKGEDLDQTGVMAAEKEKQAKLEQQKQQAKPQENAQINEHKRRQQQIRNAYDYAQMGREIDRSVDGIEGNMMPPSPGRPPMGGGPRMR